MNKDTSQKVELFHADIKLPKGFNSKVGTVCLTYGVHAHNAALDDKYGPIILPRSFNTNESQIIEVELTEGQVTKLVYRTAYSKNYDLILVCSPKGNLFFVRTVWLNARSDKHATLDRSKYVA